MPRQMEAGKEEVLDSHSLWVTTYFHPPTLLPYLIRGGTFRQRESLNSKGRWFCTITMITLLLSNTHTNNAPVARSLLYQVRESKVYGSTARERVGHTSNAPVARSLRQSMGAQSRCRMWLSSP